MLVPLSICVSIYSCFFFFKPVSLQLSSSSCFYLYLFNSLSQYLSKCLCIKLALFIDLSLCINVAIELCVCLPVYFSLSHSFSSSLTLSLLFHLYLTSSSSNSLPPSVCTSLFLMIQLLAKGRSSAFASLGRRAGAVSTKPSTPPFLCEAAEGGARSAALVHCAAESGDEVHAKQVDLVCDLRVEVVGRTPEALLHANRITALRQLSPPHLQLLWHH